MEIETFAETKNVVKNILDRNGIKYNRGLGLMGESGYPNDECQQLAEECLERIADYCRVGVNTGFTGAVKDAIDELSDICVQLSGRKADKVADKTYEKCAKAKQDIERRAQITDDCKDTVIKSRVIEYIDTSMRACDVLGTVNPNQNEILGECREVFGKLKTKVEGIYDGSSKTALGYAKEIIDTIEKWQGRASREMCTSADVHRLEEAVDLAGKWSEEYASVKQGAFRDHTAPATDIPAPIGGDIVKIVKSAEIKENLDTFYKTLENARRRNERKYDITKQKDRIAEKRAEMAALNARTAEIKKLVRNGELDEDEGFTEYEDEIEPRIDELQDQIDELEQVLVDKRKSAADDAAILDHIEMQCDAVRDCEDNPAMFYELGYDMPFEEINRIMNSEGTDEDMAKLNTISLKIEYSRKRKAEQRARMKESRNEVRQFTRDHLKTEEARRTAVAKTEEELKREEARKKRRSAFFSDGEQPEEEKQTEKAKERTDFRLTDDDK